MKWGRLTGDHRFLQMMRALYIPSLWIKPIYGLVHIEGLFLGREPHSWRSLPLGRRLVLRLVQTSHWLLQNCVTEIGK